ncbi:MAG: response regulator [Bacteroidota bacterium]
MIRILSIEDHWMVVDGLRARFRGDRDDINIACSAENLEEALKTNPDAFDLILLDLLIPGTDPQENVRKLKEQFPEKPIIVLTSEERTVWEVQMCKAGVQAYVTKSDQRKWLKEVIKKVAQGENLCKSKLAELEISSAVIQNTEDVHRLKPTEKAILALYLKENNLKEIAAKLTMTETAVAKTMARLRNEFSVKTNSGLILLLHSEKLI